MVATFVTWILPLVLMAVGLSNMIFAALGGRVFVNSDTWTERLFWAAAGVFALGLGLAVINTWELV